MVPLLFMFNLMYSTNTGIESFSGVVLHSHDYRDCKPFENKRIFIVGIGNSGLDIAVELAKVSKKVNQNKYFNCNLFLIVNCNSVLILFVNNVYFSHNKTI